MPRTADADAATSAQKRFLGVLGVLCGCCVMSMLPGCSRPSPAPPRPDILLVTIDTWRADRLGAGVSPNLDRLAASGVRFTAARTAAPLTLPSHTTILTGLLPPAHGVRENGVDVLSDTHPTIAWLLRNAGYRTAAFVGAYVLDRRFGLSAGFDTYDDRIQRDPAATERLEAERPASAVVDSALAWLDANAAPPLALPALRPSCPSCLLRVDPPLRSSRTVFAARGVQRPHRVGVR